MKTIEDLKAALAWLRSQGEPVAWVIDTPDVVRHVSHIPFMLNGYVSVPAFLAPQPAIPDGWKLVPMEPTEEMLRSAFCEAGGSYENKEGIYRAMLAAAPEPSK